MGKEKNGFLTFPSFAAETRRCAKPAYDNEKLFDEEERCEIGVEENYIGCRHSMSKRIQKYMQNLTSEFAVGKLRAWNSASVLSKRKKKKKFGV